MANNVAWTPITDNQATLSIGAIAIQPGNNDPAKSLILAATGEANNSGDSYFGLGILRSADGGNSWSLISTANSGTLSFTGLGGTRMAFGTANGQTSTAVAAMGASSEGLVDSAITSATRRGLYTSLDAGQSWTYDALSDPGGATDPTSATSVVYNDGAGKFFAAVRYHGFYSSPDGVIWTRLANQPGGAVLSAAGTVAGSYPINLQATTSGAAAPLTTSFNLVVTANPDFVMSEPSAFPAVNAGTTGVNGPISITSQDGFSGTVTFTCPATYGAGSCSVSPASVSSFPATVTLTINGSFFAAGTYALSIKGTSGSTVHTLSVPFTVGDYSISGTQTLSANPGAQAKGNLQLTSTFSYGGKINATCDASSLPGAMCMLTPANLLTLASGGTMTLTATINVPNDANGNQYNIKINTQDTTGTPSHNLSVSLTVAQDFLVTSSTASQTVTAGQTSGAYALRVLPVGSSFNGAVSLTCSAGLPAGAQCVFSPSTPVTPGNSAVDVVMNISTRANSAHSDMPVKGNFPPPAMWIPLAAIVTGASVLGNRTPTKIRQLSGCVVFCLMMMVFVSCAGVSGGGGGGQPPPPATYHITVTGTSSGTPTDAGQSATVTLVVN